MAITAAAVGWHARSKMTRPAIGFLDPRSPDAVTDSLRGFRPGVKEIAAIALGIAGASAAYARDVTSDPDATMTSEQ